MIQQMTWQTFLVATLVLTLIWYVAVVLIFYRREFIQLLGNSSPEAVNRFKQTTPLPHRWDRGVDELPIAALEEELELMGKSKLPEGMSIVGTEAFGFAQHNEAEREELVGLVPDVLEEIKLIFSKLAQTDGNKRDFLDMMVAVRETFPKIASNPNIGRINEFIIEHAPFHLSAEELENLWD